MGYSDADWAGDKDTRKSVSGNAFLYGNGAISWSSRRQRCVATSTTEAEYIACSNAGKQAKWLRGLLEDLALLELGCHPARPTLILGDNTGSLVLAKDPKSHNRAKYIDIQYHFLRQLIQEEDIELRYCPSKDQLADGLTKPISGEKFIRFRAGMGLGRIAL